MQFDLTELSPKFLSGDYTITSHAYIEMQNDGITSEFLVESIGRDNPEIIERYKHSCLVLGWYSPNYPIHLVIAMGTINQEYDTPVVVTVYRPDRDPERRWKNGYVKRKK